MNNIPDTLEIDLHTNIPGFQTIRYKPYMSFPTISQLDDHVIFNPLMKLEKAKITDARIPEPIQRKQFLNQGLFDSMVYFHNTRQAGTLEQAIDNGLIDRNIKITLDTLFKANTKVYIRNQPYTVIDYTWKPGNWKIDVKSESTPNRFNVNRIDDPYLYADVKNSQMREGETMLQQLPDKVRYGREYNTPDDSLGKGINPVFKEKEKEKEKDPVPTPVPTPDFKEKNPAPKEKDPVPQTKYVPFKNKPEPNFKNHYAILGVKKNANVDELKIAFRKKALLTHTDKNPGYKGDVTFADVKESFDLLKDPVKRKAYDVEYSKFDDEKTPVKPAPSTNAPVEPFMYPVSPTPSAKVPIVPSATNVPLKPSTAKPVVPSAANVPLKPSTEKPVIPSATNVPLKPSTEKPVVPPEKVPLTIQFITSKSNKVFQDYFKQPIFIDLVNLTYRRTLRNSKNFPQFMDVEIAPGTYNINKETYIQAVNQLTVTHNAGGGDCFFIALADAINNYNEQHESNRITHGIITGGNRIFTQSYIRSIVADDIMKGVIDIDGLLAVAIDLADELNRILRDTVALRGSPDIKEPEYLELLSDIYSSHPNAFVMMPTTLKDKSNPFQPYVKSDKLREYIMSKFYWADDLAIGSVSNALKMNIIPISQIEGVMSIPLIVANKSFNKNVFLYHNGFHYELITIKQPLLTISVFDTMSLPPFFLLFYIFAQYYFKLPNKNECNLYVDLLREIDIGFNSHYETEFIKKFAKLFPVNAAVLKQKVGAFLSGGAKQRGLQRGQQSGGQTNVTQLYQRKSELAYNISIELELYKGVLSDDQLKDAKCQYKRKKIQTAYEELFGLQRSRIPDYKLIPKQQTRRFYPRNNVTYRYPRYSNYNNINPTNYTRRYIGGKKQRFTRKMRY
jgi:hypothetical protein